MAAMSYLVVVKALGKNWDWWVYKSGLPWIWCSASSRLGVLLLKASAEHKSLDLNDGWDVSTYWPNNSSRDKECL